jgi:hypothetical protein
MLSLTMKTSYLIRVSALVLFASSIGAAQAQKLRAITVKNVTGHYRLTKGEFRNRLDVQQVSGRKIKFYLLALWVSHNNPDNIHNGELNGVVALQKGIALYDRDDCKLKFEFLPNRVRIVQLNDEGCGFGANVTAAGTYRMLDSKKPKFDF